MGSPEFLLPGFPSRIRGTPRSAFGSGGIWPNRLQLGGIQELLASTDKFIAYYIFFLYFVLLTACREVINIL
jgi:hypothetical protein